MTAGARRRVDREWDSGWDGGWSGEWDGVRRARSGGVRRAGPGGAGRGGGQAQGQRRGPGRCGYRCAGRLAGRHSLLPRTVIAGASRLVVAPDAWKEDMSRVFTQDSAPTRSAG
ncbi:hypothetical protein GCM10023324_35600 [Streptomyces youssoufiensis]